MFAILILALDDSVFRESNVFEKPGLIVFPSPTNAGVCNSMEFFINSYVSVLSLNSSITHAMSCTSLLCEARLIRSGTISKLFPNPTKSLGPAVLIFILVVKRSMSEIFFRSADISPCRTDPRMNHSTAFCLFWSKAKSNNG